MLWMTDSQQKKMERVSNFFLSKKNVILPPPPKMERAKKRHSLKKLIPRKNGESKEAIFFSKKET